jgi:hypothetical protein
MSRRDRLFGPGHGRVEYLVGFGQLPGQFGARLRKVAVVCD